MRRKQSTGGMIGTAVLTLGIGGLVWNNVHTFNPNGLAKLAVITGVILVCYGRLVTRTAANDQSYRLGYDIGREDGFKEGHQHARPVVVDLEARRCICGKSKALSSAGSAVDRG